MRLIYLLFGLLTSVSALAQPAQNLILVTLDDVRWQEVLMVPGVTASGEQSAGPVLFQNQIAATLARLLGFDFKSDHPVGKPIDTISSGAR